LGFSSCQTQMKLDGVSVKVSGLPLTGQESINNTQIRRPTGGVPPYEYASGSPLIASVTREGKVTGLRNGTTPIYVTDQEGTTRTYLVAVTNIVTLWRSGLPMSSDEAIAWMADKGPDAAPVWDPFIYDLLRVYDLTPLHNYYWMCTLEGCWPPYRAYFRKGGGIACRAQDVLLHAWCIQPI